MFDGNVRTVVPDELYRSGQLKGQQLADVLESKHIKSVINLRGISPGNKVLEEERSYCKTKGIKHVDIKMSAFSLPVPEELR